LSKTDRLLMLASDLGAPPEAENWVAAGGIGGFSYELLKNLRPHYGSIGVVTRSENQFGDDDVIGNGLWRSISMPEPFSPKILWKLVATIRLVLHIFVVWRLAGKLPNAPLLATHWFPDGYVAYLVAKLRRRKYFVVVHAYEAINAAADAGRRKRLLTVLKSAESVICVSKYTANQIEVLVPGAINVIVIPNGVDLERFSPDATSRDEVRASLGISGKTTLLTVGRLVPRKGHELVLRSLPSLIQADPNIVYLIGGDGPERGALETLVDDLGIGDSVMFLGSISPIKLPGIYRAADIFVMPNREGAEPGNVEGFGLVFLEAAAVGTPALGGDSGGVSDAIVHGETGYLVTQNDVVAITKYLNQMIVDSLTRGKIGNAAYTRAVNGFSWNLVAENYAGVMTDKSTNVSRRKISH
jgi:phosphatidyl-myo-inositol dimannoside synthase